MKLKIEKIDRKDGVTADGRQYHKVGVYADGQWYSTFDDGALTKNWIEGPEIDVQVAVKEVNGKTYNNIVLPKANNSSALMEVIKALKTENNQFRERFQEIEDRLEKLEIVGKKSVIEDDNVEDEDLLTDDLPF
jgi:hypothetical protein